MKRDAIIDTCLLVVIVVGAIWAVLEIMEVV